MGDVLAEILATVALAGALKPLYAVDCVQIARPVVALQQDASVQRSDEHIEKPVTAQPDVEAPKVRFVFAEHPSIRVGKVLRIDFEAKLQEHIQQSYAGATTSAGLDTFELHRNRIGVQGTLFNHIEFEVERELTETELVDQRLPSSTTSASPWKDVDVNVNYINNGQVRAGKFKIPFGLDELTGTTQGDFVDRSLGAKYLAPSRDIGVMVHGRFFHRGLNYWTGVFSHDGENARSTKIQGGDRTFAARVTGTPLRPLNRALFGGFEVGGALAMTALSDESFRPNGLRGRTVMTDDTFFDSVYVNGRRRRVEVDLDWLVARAAIRAEFTHVTDDRLGQGLAAADLPAARCRAWYISSAYMLTGEPYARPVTPEADFLGGGIGAIELAARFERLWGDSVGGQDVPLRGPRAETIRPSGDWVLTIGVNWTLNRWTRVQFNAIREQVDDLERNPVPIGAAFWSRVIRLQFVL